MHWLYYLFFSFVCVFSKTLVLNLNRRVVHHGKRTSRSLDRRISAHSIKSVTNDQSNSPLTNFQNDFYTANISLGTPEQIFEVQMDTGSSNLWVFRWCSENHECLRYRNGTPFIRGYFDPNSSSTFHNDSRSFKINYEDGTYSGYLGVDRLKFAGFTLERTTFGLITSRRLSDDSFINGVFGLGWPSLAVGGIVSPIHAILNNLDKPIFTVYMGINSGTGHNPSCDYPNDLTCTGRITYGGLDEDYCSSDVEYVQLSAISYWQFTLQGFQIGSYKENRRQQAISDSGTSWIGVPKDIFKNIIEQTGATYRKGDDLYVVSCLTDLPTIFLTIGGNSFDIPSYEYRLDFKFPDGQCVLAFFEQSSGGFVPSWILGDPFIRSWCNVYDFGQRRIGFAQPKYRISGAFTKISHLITFLIVYCLL